MSRCRLEGSGAHLVTRANEQSGIVFIHASLWGMKQKPLILPSIRAASVSLIEDVWVIRAEKISTRRRVRDVRSSPARHHFHRATAWDGRSACATDGVRPVSCACWTTVSLAERAGFAANRSPILGHLMRPQRLPSALLG